MRIISQARNTIIENVVDFKLEQTLECGQCFHFDKIDEDEYAIVAKNRLLHMKQVDDTLIFYHTDAETVKSIWMDYFDLNRDYREIKDELIKKDPFLRKAIEAKSGVRLLNQDFVEILLSFILSQNKQIPHIKQIVKVLSEQYGEPAGELDGKVFYSFPNLTVLSQLKEEDFRACKAGFRAPYLVDACRRLTDGSLKEEELRSASYEDAMGRLLQIKGVGVKVANCVLLYGLGHRNSFPVDVWIKRIMEEVYLEKDTPNHKIQEFAAEHFGQYGGYAQQYLFTYGREMKTGR